MNFLGKNSLAKQLLIIVAITFFFLFLSLGIILPRLLMPIAESNLYNYLSEPLKIYNTTVDNELSNSEIAFLYISDNKIEASGNIGDVIKYDNLHNLVNKMTNPYGKFIHNHKTY